MIHNPYMDALKKIPPSRGIYGDFMRYSPVETWGSDTKKFKDYRQELVTEYSWAIPCDASLKVISDFTKSICEIGAGTGYWAYMLSQFNVDIVAYDLRVPGIHKNEYAHKKTWFEVKHGDVLSINQHQDRTLMLCWPPYEDDMAEKILDLYTGDKVIYIGEGEGGCTANNEFHSKIYNLFEEVNTIHLLQWDGIHDNLHLYKRK